MNDENGAERKNTSSNSGGYVIYILNWDPEIIMGKKKKKKKDFTSWQKFTWEVSIANTPRKGYNIQYFFHFLVPSEQLWYICMFSWAEILSYWLINCLERAQKYISKKSGTILKEQLLQNKGHKWNIILNKSFLHGTHKFHDDLLLGEAMKTADERPHFIFRV